MKRKLLFSFPVFQTLFWGCLFIFSAHFTTAQSIDMQQALTGEWRAPDAFYEGRKYSLTIVFAGDAGGLRAFVSGNMNLDEGKRSPYYSSTELKMSGKGLSFALKGTKLTVFYEGEFSPGSKILTMRYSDKPFSESKESLIWNLKKVPLCHDPEGISEATENLWEDDRRVGEVLKILPTCFPLDLYDEQVSLLRALVILRGGDFAPQRGVYSPRQRENDALDLFRRSMNLPYQSPRIFYAAAEIYYEHAMRVTRELNLLLEADSKEPPYRRWTPEKIAEEKERARKEALKMLDLSIANYSTLIAENSFYTDAYARRARIFYIKWSKYEPNDDHLKSALADYKAAIELNPFSYELFYERSLIYSYLGEKEKAEADVQRSTELKINKIGPYRPN